MSFGNFMSFFWYLNMVIGLWSLPYLKDYGTPQAIGLVIFFGCAGLICTFHTLGVDRQNQQLVKETFRVRG